MVTAAEPLRTIKSVSRQTGIPYQTLRRLIRLRQVPSVSVAGLPPRLRLSQVQAAIVERRTAV
jgi:hypothetical protein